MDCDLNPIRVAGDVAFSGDKGQPYGQFIVGVGGADPLANVLYDKGRQGFLSGDIDWDADNIKVILIDSADYTVDLALHDFLDDVPAGARVAISGNLTSKTTTDGVADAADVTFSSVSGDVSEALIIYQDTGAEATSRLIAYFDTATGLPVTPNGGDIDIAWDSGANKIFKL